jgi:translation initiation factor IF-1
MRVDDYKLLEGDVIIVEYDPIEWKLTFDNNRFKN